MIILPSNNLLVRKAVKDYVLKRGCTTLTLCFVCTAQAYVEVDIRVAISIFEYLGCYAYNLNHLNYNRYNDRLIEIEGGLYSCLIRRGVVMTARYTIVSGKKISSSSVLKKPFKTKSKKLRCVMWSAL